MATYDPDPSEFDDMDSSGNDNSAIRQLREHAKNLEKQLKATLKEAEELKEFKQAREREVKTEQLKSAFAEVGLNDKQTELFLAVRPDAEPTAEAVRAFAEEYGFVASDETAADRGFAPTPTEGTSGSKKRYTSEEFDALYKSNPHEAIKAANEGRVDFETTL